MRIKCVLLSAVALLVGLGATVAASAQSYRDTPACLNEQLSKQELQNRLNDPNVIVGNSPPPGDPIMYPPFGDPLYQGSNWEKRQWTQIFRTTELPKPLTGPIYVIRAVVVVHYMWNTTTHQAFQVKFASSVDQSCTGKRELSSANDPGAIDPSMTTPIYSGTNPFNYGITYYEKTPVVTSGPLTVVPPGGGDSGGGSGGGAGSTGGGSGGGTGGDTGGGGGGGGGGGDTGGGSDGYDCNGLKKGPTPSTGASSLRSTTSSSRATPLPSRQKGVVAPTGGATTNIVIVCG